MPILPRFVNPAMPKKGQRLDRTLAFVSVATLVIGLAIFWTFGFRDRISSDAAVTLLLAQHILDTGALLPNDWYYGNGDIWIIGPQIVALPFVAIFGPTPLALALTNALGLLIIFLSALVLGRIICGRWPAAVLAATLCISLYSHFQREFVIMQLSYGWMSAKLFLLLSAIVLWLRSSERRPTPRWTYIILAVYILLLGTWTAENPVRPLLYLGIPLTIVLGLKASRLQYPTLSLLAATFAGLGVGWIVRQWILSDVAMAPGLESFRFASPSAWLGNVQILVEGFDHLYGGTALGDPSLPFAHKALAILRLCILPAAIVALVRRSDGSDEPRQWRWLTLQVALVDLAIVAVVLVIGATLVDPVGDRYLIPPWHLSLVGLVAGSAYAAQRWHLIAALLVLAFLVGGFANAVSIMRAQASSDLAGLPHPPPVDGLIGAVTKAGIVNGFATHRYANAATVRSQGRIQICDVLFEPEVRPARWVNTKSCSDPVTYSAGFFVVLAPGESTPDRVSRLRATIGEPVSTIRIDGYDIWVFPDGVGDRSWLAR